MDASDSCVRFAAEVNQKARDLAKWYTTIPAMMCLADVEGRLTYSPIPEIPADRPELERVLLAAEQNYTLGVAIIRLSRCPVNGEQLVVLAFTADGVWAEMTPVDRTGPEIQFGQPIELDCGSIDLHSPAPSHFTPQVSLSGYSGSFSAAN
jgi:hypothetical protein